MVEALELTFLDIVTSTSGQIDFTSWSAKGNLLSDILELKDFCDLIEDVVDVVIVHHTARHAMGSTCAAFLEEIRLASHHQFLVAGDGVEQLPRAVACFRPPAHIKQHHVAIELIAWFFFIKSLHVVRHPTV